MTESQHLEAPTIDRIVDIYLSDSMYIKPMRAFYKMDDTEMSWDCVKAHDSVSVILFNESRNKLLFVRQFRPAVVVASSFKLDTKLKKLDANAKVSGYTLELCAGIIDKAGKDLLEIAKEEVLEETGYSIPISSLRFVNSARSGVGVSGSLHTLYFATVKDEQRVSKGGGVENERIEVVEMDLEDAKKMMWREDEEALDSRPISMLLGLAWFFYEYLPSLPKER